MTSSAIYYSTDARKNEIYLLNKTYQIRRIVACIGFQIIQESRVTKVVNKRFLHVKNRSLFKNINKKGLCFKPLTVTF